MIVEEKKHYDMLLLPTNHMVWNVVSKKRLQLLL